MKIVRGIRISHNTNFVTDVNVIINLVGALKPTSIADQISVIRTFDNLLLIYARLSFDRASIADFTVKFCHFEFSPRLYLRVSNSSKIGQNRLNVGAGSSRGHVIDRTDFASICIRNRNEVVRADANDSTLDERIHQLGIRELLSAALIDISLTIGSGLSIDDNRGNILVVSMVKDSFNSHNMLPPKIIYVQVID
nr:MAG TPA: hypothetical protein [Caudoviricetes sp.]